ncbi:MAG: hypothetical protein R3C62_18765 [Chloroflexota bacterium]
MVVRWRKWLILFIWVSVGGTAVVHYDPTLTPSNTVASAASTSATPAYVVVAWNDLGMHCYNRDFQDLAVLPPFNTLWAQVIKTGNPPQLLTENIRVTYEFPDNTYSVGKSNFWDYDVQLFGVDLPPNVGLAGKGLAGEMDLIGSDHFEAAGIPLTEFRDSDVSNPYPYQLATVIAYNATTNEELARITTVAPVSTEMHCDNCHDDGGVEEITTGRVETNILTLHDRASMGSYPQGHEGALMNRRPILCAECHASNALGAVGVAGIPSLSKAMHDKHSGVIPATKDGCYQCHPGPETQCLRDVMATDHNMDCLDCHGNLETVANNPQPWLNEPRCDSCHGAAYQQDQALYRFSTEHGGLYCSACHDSPHAIAPTSQPNDSIKFVALQGHNGTLDTCTVCHTSQPLAAGPHGSLAPYVELTLNRLNPNDLDLSWLHRAQNNRYRVWYHATDPYFEAGTTTALSTLDAPSDHFLLADALADSANGFYVVVAENGVGSYTSNRVGEFNFTLVNR